jgi:serine/threonine-protein kinase
VSARTDPWIGAELAGYRIERLLGRGGMAVVYLAQDLRLKRRVALKLLAPELAEDERFRERFLRESELAASLDHQNVIPIYEAGEADGLLYIAMRYVDGSDLRERLRASGALEPAAALALLAQVAGALDAAHAHGLVHRDVKPGNVLIARDGHVYLSDFGLTKQARSEGGVTETGQFVGTVDYVAPEQIERDLVDGRSDQYGLACVLYECLAGEPPYGSDSLTGTLWAHIAAPQPSARELRPELPDAIDPVVARGMAKKPGERYPTCTALIAATQAALGLSGQLATRPARSRRWRWLSAAAVVIAAVAAAVTSLVAGGHGERGPDIAPTTAITTASLQRIDPATNTLVATMRGLKNASAVSAGEGAVWVSSREGDTLSRLDPATNTVTSVPTGPGARNVLAAGGAVWVLGARFDLSRYGPHDGRVVQQLSAHETGGPLYLAYGARSLWGTVICACGQLDWEGAEEAGVVRIPYRNTALSGNGIDRSELPTLKATGIAFGSGSVWVANDEVVLAELWRFAAGSVTKVAARVHLEGGAAGVVFGAGAFWVPNPQDDALSRIDPARNTVVAKIPVGDDPVAIAFGDGSAWVTNYSDGTVSRIDPTTNRVVATIRVGPHPEHIAVGDGGVWVTVHP